MRDADDAVGDDDTVRGKYGGAENMIMRKISKHPEKNAEKCGRKKPSPLRTNVRYDRGGGGGKGNHEVEESDFAGGGLEVP